MIVSPYLQPLRKAHVYQGESNDCGPYSVTIVVNALRAMGINPREMAQRMNRPRLRGGILVVRRIPNWATFPWGVADALKECGLPARWRPLADESTLARRLGNGEILLPIIGEWRPKPWAHIAPLVAWDEQKGWGFVDPLMPTSEVYWRPAGRFTRQWRAYFRTLVYIPSPLHSEEPLFSTISEPIA
ncbi:MAG: hypothetical protein D6755_06525 [Anaerolineae bacterium]|nr:MAG: hypothetical protein D6755_06525 [Anaerolineae bacterium]